MSNNQTLAQEYNHLEIEADIYSWWEQEGYFKPEKMVELGILKDRTSPQTRYCITYPLANVTGALHVGHAITISIEDFMTRYNRMMQKETLFIPGTDHAGIATQNVVERELAKQKIYRKQIGREKFVEKVWEWKKIYHQRITQQSKSMGMSSDWSRERFTLDEPYLKAVREAFYRLYTKGLIYRAEYMVNWCPGRCESAISDIETELEEAEGNLWYIKYPLVTTKFSKPNGEWGSGTWASKATEFIIVATTRPETLLGDTAIATTPNHKDYQKFIGKNVLVPVNGRKIPIIADSKVDPNFGTGALKITPGHDPNDYEIGIQHKLQQITILDAKGLMISDNVGKYRGMDRFECRKAIVEDLKKEGLLVKIEPYTHSEPHCQRCHTIIEPRISTQWFVNTKPLAAEVIKRVQEKQTIIIPEREEKRFYQWMENIRPWCISRQLWWGHQIPIWYCESEGCKKEICPSPDVNEVTKCPYCNGTKIKRDPDVLDTWFSSGLWPFSTLGWPNTAHPDYQRFFPTDTRETGYDILFFWVAREMMMGIELTGQVPYKTVYLHGIIRNDKGQKISKSMENIQQYDPLNIIKDYGADSLRFVLLSNSVPGLDMNLDPRNLVAAHRFCNKIWQSVRFVMNNIQDDSQIPSLAQVHSQLELGDKWILSKLQKLIKNVDQFITNYDYLNATREVKNFYWNDFCDWYIEITKSRLYGEDKAVALVPKAVLLYVIDTCLRLLHPIIPFVTEKLWQTLPDQIKDGPALIVAKWPQIQEEFVDDKLEDTFTFASEFIREIRRIRKDFNVKASTKIPLIIDTKTKADIFNTFKNEIINLASVDPNQLILTNDPEIPKQSVQLTTHPAFIPLATIIDFVAERKRIEKQIDKVSSDIQNLTAKLAGPFAQKAAADVVAKEREKLQEFQDKFKELQTQLAMMNK